ncbi:phosphatidylserine/phosphatidylglycerophosphate/cardiolipin synthase-like enzyme [Haloplanus aerogenes]|uniref:Phosphatidylserine/phosphatidylglycerophosphate/ cardiolipin synthase-like enzyme n=1 Tax=Haloplanus aerogenes TaxID=660522 RepID=A0A3M0DYV0_9EURY|nr:phosphatidylserine/phosphatidylglycerophosphate/cardiolipin synthase-like enzyme [Haloplanus aerogenes]
MSDAAASPPVSRRLRLVVVVLVVAAVVPTTTPVVDATTANATTADADIVATLPNPTADGDTGEFVVLRVPTTEANWTLDDGERVVALPADRPAARVAVGADPNATRRLADAPVVAVSHLSLSNSGERLRLRRDGVVVATLAYRDAPEGERLVRTDDGTRWRPVGYRPRDVHRYGPATVTGFVLPDTPSVPVETLRGARDRIFLAGYTFTSDRVAAALIAAERRGVDVRVLVDADPVGGRTARGADTLDRLAAAGVDVAVLGGPRARFDYHHPKYAVVDDRALVTTENWKPAGVGGQSSRGWGVVVESAPVAADLAGLFRADAGWRDALPWGRFRRGKTFEAGMPAEGSYPSRFDPTTATAAGVRVLTAPGNAESALVGVIDGAGDRVDVIQPTIGRRDGPLLRATIRAAERGVTVRILLSGAWYVAEENAALVEWLNGVADRRDLPLTARVAEPSGRYEKIHAKGVVVDDTVVVGSLNWNANAVSENREVALAVRSESLASYFRETFAADWRGGRGGGRTTWVIVAGALAALVLALVVARKTIRFGR